MAIGFQNLSSDLKQAIAGTYPDIGQTMYLVNSAYRTAAQGWSRADRTGPLDLAEARKAGPGGVQYVFRDGDYSSTAAAVQAAHDATVAFRGDDIFFTPGNYSVGTAVTITNNAVRLLGQPRGRFNGNTTITATVANALTIGSAVSDVEFAFLRVVPLTAQPAILVTGASSNLWMHDWQYDARGVAASTSTVGVSFTGAALNVAIERGLWYTDAAQGPVVKSTAANVGFVISDALHYHTAGTLASVITMSSVTLNGFLLDRLTGVATGGGVVTNVVTLGDNTSNTVDAVAMNCRLSKGYAGAAALFVSFGVAAETNVLDCRLGADGGTAGSTTPLAGTAITQ